MVSSASLIFVSLFLLKSISISFSCLSCNATSIFTILFCSFFCLFFSSRFPCRAHINVLCFLICVWVYTSMVRMCVCMTFSVALSHRVAFTVCVFVTIGAVVIAVRSGYINSSCFALLVCSTMNLNTYINPSVAANDQGDQSRTVTIKL